VQAIPSIGVVASDPPNLILSGRHRIGDLADQITSMTKPVSASIQLMTIDLDSLTRIRGSSWRPAPDELLREQLLIENCVELAERPFGELALHLEHPLTAFGSSGRDPSLFIQKGGHLAGVSRGDLCVSLAVLRDQFSEPRAFDCETPPFNAHLP
jgi:hypothetical protein